MGVKRRAPTRPDPTARTPVRDPDEFGIDDAAKVLKERMRMGDELARPLAQQIVAAFFIGKCRHVFTDPEVRKALYSSDGRGPFRMAAMMGDEVLERTALEAALPGVAEIVQEADPEGTLPFFGYQKDTVLAIGRAFVTAWEEVHALAKPPLHGLPAAAVGDRTDAVVEDEEVPF
jgi:hypothetical protein